MPLKKIEGELYIIEKFNRHKHNYVKAIDNNDIELLEHLFDCENYEECEELVENALYYAMSSNNLDMTRDIIHYYIRTYGENGYVLDGLLDFSIKIGCIDEIYDFIAIYKDY